jgi:hypothetical protein
VKPKVWNYALICCAWHRGFAAIDIYCGKLPVIYVYFNELAGGVDGTYGDYNLDYYACSAKPAADWIAKNLPYDLPK